MMTTALPHELAAVFQDPEWFEDFKRMPSADWDGIVEVWGKRKDEQGLGLVEILADSRQWALADFRKWLTAGDYDPTEIIEAREVTTKEVVLKPYPNEHAARVIDPGAFELDSLRSKTLPNGVRLIMGRERGSEAMTVQAYRFPTDHYTEQAARAWLKENKVEHLTFEPATGDAAKAIDEALDALDRVGVATLFNDLFEHPRLAKARALELGGTGYHAHEVEGRPLFMPSDSLGDYERLTLQHPQAPELAKAEWSAAYRNDLPDSAFFYIEPGGEKLDGKTEPRSLRKLPYRDASGAIDLPHLRNALARLDQTDLPASTQARIRSEARRMLEEETAKKSVAENYEALDLTPPEAVQRAAELGLALRREHERGGTMLGVLKAKGLAAGSPCSPEAIRCLCLYFDRHAKDLSVAKNFDRSDPDYPGPAGIAWLLRGGHPGRDWASGVLRAMRRHDIEKARRRPQEMGDLLERAPAPTDALDVESLRRLVNKSAGGAALTWAPLGARYIVAKGATGARHTTPTAAEAHEDALRALWAGLPDSTAVEVVACDDGRCWAADLLGTAGLDLTPLDFGTRKALLGVVLGPDVLTASTALVSTSQDLVLTARELSDHHEGGAVEVRDLGASYGAPVARLALEEHRPALWKFVPPRHAERPRALFVTGHPNTIETIRGVPLAGPDGHTFRTAYLDRMGLGIEEATVVHACPAAGGSVEEWGPWLDQMVAAHGALPIIALGKAASAALKQADHVTMPHPRAVRLRGDRGEIERKAKSIQKALATLDHLAAQTYQCPILKADEDARMVYGVVLEPHTVDLQGDVLALDTIETAAHKYLVRSRTVGDSHSRQAGAEVVESYLAPADLELGGQTVSMGSWVMGVHVTDGDLWEAVKSGEYTGFSIGGNGERKAIPTAQNLPPA